MTTHKRFFVVHPVRISGTSNRKYISLRVLDICEDLDTAVQSAQRIAFDDEFAGAVVASSQTGAIVATDGEYWETVEAAEAALNSYKR